MVNPYEPSSESHEEESHEEESHEEERRPSELPTDEQSLTEPTLAYTANGNLEAHSVVAWLESNGVPAHAVEDNAGVGLFVFGTISQFHKPQVFVNDADLPQASELLRQFESQRQQRREVLEGAPWITSVCEECGEASEFPASQDGTTQNCPKCNSYMDVGTLEWPENFDFSGSDPEELAEGNAEEAMDAAIVLDHQGNGSQPSLLMMRLPSVGPSMPPTPRIALRNCIAN